MRFLPEFVVAYPMWKWIKFRVRQGKENRALVLVDRLQAWYPNSPYPVYMEFWVKNSVRVTPPGEILGILRRGWSKGPHIPTFVMLAVGLQDLYEETGAVEVRGEIEELLRWLREQAGPGSIGKSSAAALESEIRGNLAAADGDLIKARAEFMKAADSLPPAVQYHPRKQSSFGDQYVALGDVDEAVLHYEAALPWRDSWPRINLSILLEKRDPASSQLHLEEARRLWKGHPQAFEPKLANVRQKVQRRLERVAKQTSH